MSVAGYEARGRYSKALRKELDALMVERNALIDAHIKGLIDPAESEPRLKAQLERKREMERRLVAAQSNRLESLPGACVDR